MNEALERELTGPRRIVETEPHGHDGADANLKTAPQPSSSATC
jgi:hypothetical protein